VYFALLYFVCVYDIIITEREVIVMEFKIRNYELTLVNGEKKIVQCSRYHLKAIMKELKVCGYRILDI